MQNRITTDAFAKAVGVNPNTIRHALCKNGHYMGVRPLKLPNRWLAWPRDEIDALLSEKLGADASSGRGAR